MAKWRRALGAAVLAVLPGIGDGTRQVVDPQVAPWSSLVRVQSPGAGRCTGVVIGPKQVLTAAHCLFNARTGHFLPPESVHVLSRYAAGRFASHGVAVTYRTLDGWVPGHPPRFGRDAAVLTLAEAVDAPALPLAEAGAGEVLLGGYNQDRAEVLEADPACRLMGFTRDAAGESLLRHDCAATRGTSGGAVFVRAGEGWAVGGLQVGAWAGRGGVAVPAAALRALLAGG